MPAFPAKLAAMFSELTMPNPLLNKEQLLMLYENNQVTGKRPEKVFSISFKSLEEYLDEL